MIKFELENILRKDFPRIELNDFNTIERAQDYFLRFELGDNLRNARKRVLQATDRAYELFQNHFDLHLNFYIVAYDFEDELFARTPDQLFHYINREFERHAEKLAPRYFDHETDIEYTKGDLIISKTDFANTDPKKIFEAIANAEMGFSPTIHQIVFFFQPETLKWFWMYDDRGCLLFSKNKTELKQLYLKYQNWIVEYWRTEIENQFI